MAITIVVADDHPLIIEGLVALFEAERDLKVVALCCDGDEALNALKKHDPDILVLDIHMPGTDGLAVLRAMQKAQVSARVIMLTAQITEQDLTEAVRLGLRGLLLKELPLKLVIQCVRDVHAGKLWLEQRSVSMALEKLLQNEADSRAAAQVLTPRELQIMKHVVAGLRNGEIGRLLFISEGTVKMHLHNIYRKLHVDSRIKLSRYAQVNALV